VWHNRGSTTGREKLSALAFFCRNLAWPAAHLDRRRRCVDNLTLGPGQNRGAHLPKLPPAYMPQDSQPACHVIVFNIGKKHNVGTIARCCTAFGAASVCLVGSRQFNTFGAHGADAHVTFQHFETLDVCCSALRGQGCSIVGIEIVEGAQPVHKHPFTGPTAFLLGNEGQVRLKAWSFSARASADPYVSAANLSADFVSCAISTRRWGLSRCTPAVSCLCVLSSRTWRVARAKAPPTRASLRLPRSPIAARHRRPRARAGPVRRPEARVRRVCLHRAARHRHRVAQRRGRGVDRAAPLRAVGGLRRAGSRRREVRRGGAAPAHGAARHAPPVAVCCVVRARGRTAGWWQAIRHAGTARLFQMCTAELVMAGCGCRHGAADCAGAAGAAACERER
jgi:SpoU rRNA Methylase family